MEWDLLIVGAGPTGLACAIEAANKGLRALVVDKGCLVNSIFHYPANMVFFTTSELLEIGGVPFACAQAKPSRLEALEYYRKVAAHFALNVHLYERVGEITALAPGRPGFRISTDRGLYQAENVVIATGYYDLPNLLGIPGENLPHVFHYFREAHAFAGLRVAVIGGKNFAVESALDLFRHGARVTLVHRRAELASSIKYWVRPDIENRLKAGEITARFSSQVREIRPRGLRLSGPQGDSEIEADFVFALTGYHPDFAFLRAAGVALGEGDRPVCDPATYETNVSGLYLGGVVVAGRHTSEIFIENGRFHGQVIVASVLAQRAAMEAR
ncbi:MAG: YpdA family putative bacillithiol disulfide reductase [Terriglobales bacterium]